MGQMPARSSVRAAVRSKTWRTPKSFSAVVFLCRQALLLIRCSPVWGGGVLVFESMPVHLLLFSSVTLPGFVSLPSPSAGFLFVRRPEIPPLSCLFHCYLGEVAEEHNDSSCSVFCRVLCRTLLMQIGPVTIPAFIVDGGIYLKAIPPFI